jgi:general secretion pathway protein D
MKIVKIFLVGTALLLGINLYVSAQQDTTSKNPPLETTTQKENSDNLISINLQDTDINQAIKILGDITGMVIIPHDNLKGKVTIVSLEKIEPEVIANVLESALMVRGFTLVKSGNALKVIPLSETRQTNVAVKVGSSPDFIKEEDVVITQVMPLNYASAIKLKNELQSLVGKHGNILANQRTNTIVVTDTSSNIRRLATIISQMDHPLPARLQIKTFILNYGDAKKIAEILNGLSNKDEKDIRYPRTEKSLRQNEPLEIFGEIQTFVEEETNAIVVATAPINFPAIERLIRKLDIFPSQTMIEVVIMDVTLDDDFTMGIEFSHPTNTTSTKYGAQIDAGASPYRESIFHSFLGLATDASTRGFTYRILNKDETLNLLGFILNSQENSKVISTPRILASNNQESIIKVGQEIPIIESSVTDLVNNVTTVNYKYEDVGLQLKVTPRISQDGFVNLKIHAELKDLSAQTLYDASIINTREADAIVIIPDGHTVVLGGLMRDNDSIIEHKIPLLGDIPILGNFFKKTETALLKTELLIFLTPHVLKSTEDLKRITSPAKEKMQNARRVKTKMELKRAVKNIVEYYGPEENSKKEESPDK